MTERPAVLIVERGGMRAVYEPDLNSSIWATLDEQIEAALSIGARPLYAFRLKSLTEDMQ